MIGQPPDDADGTAEIVINYILTWGTSSEMPVLGFSWLLVAFGVVFEIYSHSYELTYSHGAY